MSATWAGERKDVDPDSDHSFISMEAAACAEGFGALGIDASTVAELRFTRRGSKGYLVHARPAHSDAFYSFGSEPCTREAAEQLAAYCGLVGALAPMDEFGGLRIVRVAPPPLPPATTPLMTFPLPALGGARFD